MKGYPSVFLSCELSNGIFFLQNLVTCPHGAEFISFQKKMQYLFHEIKWNRRHVYQVPTF